MRFLEGESIPRVQYGLSETLGAGTEVQNSFWGVSEAVLTVYFVLQCVW